jgi:peptidoglycan hydrolase-like protein with peptidoglycan-binding domain
MQRLEARSYGASSRFPRWAMVLVVLLLVGGAAGAAYAFGRSGRGSPRSGAAGGAAGRGGHHSGGSGDGAQQTATGTRLHIVSFSPANEATQVATDTPVTVTFSQPVVADQVQPSLAPPVAGAWQPSGRRTLKFVPSAPMVPFTKETVTVPGGSGGVRAQDGGTLHASSTFSFTVADGSMLRLQQLLAQLQYLPLTFTPSGPAPAPADAAQPQQGNFAWRWTTLPPNLTSLWTPGYEDIITKGAIMTFENTHSLTVDGLAGPEVWADVLADAAAGKVDPQPYTYVLVSKVIPENLTLWNDGVAQLTGIPVNTGLHGADTTDGTYPVFEHVLASEMKGVNPDGTHYDDPNVPWASYFNGGDALHGFVRATYGTPQSNGCVEMAVADAAKVWPLTPIGTLVTVIGPSS